MRVCNRSIKFKLAAATIGSLLVIFCAHAEDLPKELSLDLGKGAKLDLVLIPAGSFEMGSGEKEEGRRKTETSHKIAITAPFYMGKFEVTQEQFEALAGENPSANKGPTLPVERVTWEEATKYCLKVSEVSARTAMLPTEAQWEYACRAGTATVYNIGNTITATDANLTGGVKPTVAVAVVAPKLETGTTPDTTPVAPVALVVTTDPVTVIAPTPGTPPGVAPPPVPVPAIGTGTGTAPATIPIAATVVSAPPKTMPVGSFKPNAFGLYDMHGNVWEWCRDWYDENYYATSTAQDPEGPAKSTEEPPARVLRGGSYFGVPVELRSACRDCLGPADRNAHGGFRIIILIEK